VLAPLVGWFLPTLALSTGIYASWQRGQELRRVSRVLGQTSLDIDSVLHGGKQSAEDKLYDLVESNAKLRGVMQKEGATRDDLRKIYWRLMAAGAGQWVRGHFTPASSLCYGFTLEFVLSKLREEEATHSTPKEIWQDAGFRLVDHFQKGKVGRV
jgi:hypothetical protein